LVIYGAPPRRGSPENSQIGRNWQQNLNPNLEISELIKILTKWGNKLIQETWKEKNARIAAEAPHLNEQI